MPATASSAYVLEDRASSTFRVIRREAERTTLAVRRTADATDRLGSPSQLQRLDRLERRFGNVARAAELMGTRVSRAVDRMEGTIRRDTLLATDRLLNLEHGLQTVGRTTATPRVQLEGVTQARAEMALLRRDLDALSRSSASPNVGGAAGGGGRVLAGATPSGGGGRFPSVGRGGLIAGAVVVGLPVLGAAPAVLGSAVGAGLGAGALGAAGAGAGAAGLIGILSVVKPAEKAVKNVAKAQAAYTQAVALHGVVSKQATTAQDKLNVAIANAPAGAATLTKQITDLGKVWQQVTRPGQASLLRAGATVAGQIRGVAPFLGAQANTSAAALRGSATHLGGYFTGPGSLLTLQSLTHDFARDLPVAERSLENVAGTFGNISRAASPFFHDGLMFVQRWTAGWELSTRDIGDTRRTIGGYVNDLKAWGRLSGATWDLIRDLIMPGRTQGTSLVADLTRQLARWDEWARLNPDRIRRFYHDAIDGTKQLAGLIATLTGDLHQLAGIIVPLLGHFAALGQLAGGAGLLLPTAIRLGLGRVAGRGGGSSGGSSSGAGGGAGGGFGGILPFGGPWTAAGRDAAALRARRAAGDWTGWTPAESLPVNRAAAARAGAANAARAGARFAAPIALISGAVAGATTQGSLGERAQGAISGATFGLFPGPTTRAQSAQQGGARALAYLQGLGTPSSAAGYNAQIAQVQAQLARAQAGAHGHGASFLGIGLHGALIGGPQDAEMRRSAAAAKTFADALRVLRQEQASYAAEQARRSAVASQVHGQELGGSFQQAFGILSPVKGTEQALRETLTRVVSTVHKLRPEGARALTEATIAWADSIAKGNPRLQRVVEQMTSGIEHRFSNMGKHVQVVNGTVLDGSRAEWAQIKAALTTPAEQARQEVTAAFTAIQAQAAGSLRAMGYSPKEAAGLVTAAEKYGTASISASSPSGQAGRRSDVAGPVGGIGPARARGGRLPGRGLNDTVRMSDGGYGAPGELVMARHTEADASRDLFLAGKPTLDQRVRREHRRHSAPMRATGGRVGGGHFTPAPGTNYTQGSEPQIAARLEQLAQSLGLNLTGISGYRTPAHSVAVGGFPNDPHTRGQASDTPGVEGVSEATLEKFGLTRPFAGAREADHIQLLGGAGAIAGMVAAAVSGASQAVQAATVALRAPGSRLGGAPGALSRRAAALYAAGLSRRLNAALGAGGAPTGGLSLMAGGGGSVVGASMFGGPGDPGTGSTGYRGDNLNLHPDSYAELGMGRALGGLPYMAGLRVSGPRGALNLYKRDIGKGGGPVNGHARAIDLWWQAAQQLGINGTGLVNIAPLRARGGRVGWYGQGGSGTATRPTLIGIGDNGPRGEDFVVKPRKLGPATAPRRGSVAGVGSVTIHSLVVQNHREGDIVKMIRAEVGQFALELADELDGVDADQHALIR